MHRKKRLPVGFAVFVGIVTWALAAQAADTHAASAAAPLPPDQSGESSQNSTQNGGVPSFQQRHPRYRLAPGDVVNLEFPFSPEFNQTVAIQPDGYITLRGVGDFYAQGKTTPELSAALREAYGKTLHDPVITVDLKDFQKPYFVAGGEVGHPGKYDLREDTTVTAAVAIAGGFTEGAKHSQVLLFRRIPNNDSYVEAKILNLKKMLNSGNLQEDMYLRPGDMLYVPKNLISKVARFLPRASTSLYMRPY